VWIESLLPKQKGNAFEKQHALFTPRQVFEGTEVTTREIDLSCVDSLQNVFIPAHSFFPKIPLPPIHECLPPQQFCFLEFCLVSRRWSCYTPTLNIEGGWAMFEIRI